MKRFGFIKALFLLFVLNSVLFATVYEDGSSGKWVIHDDNPTGASFNFVQDDERGSVVEFSGTGTKNAFRLGNRAGKDGAWDNESEFILKWSMKFNERYAIYVRIQTNEEGYRYLKYSPVDESIGKKGTSKYLRFGLGSNTIDGKWHDITRDLQKDLKFAEPNLTIKSVNMFLVRGSGRVDDIELLSKVDEDNTTTGDNDIKYTLYEDAEDQNIVGWKVVDDRPSGATISNVYDEEKESYVIELSGNGVKNAYLLGNYAGRDGAWNNETEFNLKWSMNFSERYAIYIRVQTEKGYRYLKYTNSDKDYLKRNERSKYIHHGLGSNSADGNWHEITRDLQQDLKDAEPTNSILSVNAFKVRGSGRIDDIMLFAQQSNSEGDDQNSTGAGTTDGSDDNSTTTDSNSTDVVVSGLIADYRFDECLWNGSEDVKDQTGNYNATSYGAVAKVGQMNNGAVFEGKNDYIEIPTISGGFSDGISISAWVDFGEFANFERILELSNGISYKPSLGYSDVDRYISFHTESGKLRFQSKVDGKNASSGPIVDIPESGMHHYVATYDHVTGVAKIYIDNKLKGSAVWDKSRFDPDAIRDHNYIGRTVWGDNYPFNGLIDELKIFNKALSPEEISTIYNNESVGKNYDGTVREIVNCSNVATEDSSPQPIAEYKFDSSSWNGDQVIDSINSLNGIAIGATIGNGKVNEGSTFDGVNDYIIMGDILSPGNSDKITISMWFKLDNDASSASNVIFSKEAIYMAEVYNGYFRFAINPYWHFVGDGSFPVTAGEWTHAVITYDGVKQRLYKNGSLVFEREQRGSIGSNNQPFTIGAFKRVAQEPRYFFNGDIDEVKVYNSALTSQQVKDIYDKEK